MIGKPSTPLKMAGCIQQCLFHTRWLPQDHLLSMQWAASMLPVSKYFELATHWADPVGGSPRGDRGGTARRVLGPRGSWDSAFMCDIVIDMPEVVRDGPIGVLDMDRGLSGLGATGCKLPKCLAFLSSSASNCRSMDPQSACRLFSLLLRYVSSPRAVPVRSLSIQGLGHSPGFEGSAQ